MPDLSWLLDFPPFFPFTFESVTFYICSIGLILGGIVLVANLKHELSAARQHRDFKGRYTFNWGRKPEKQMR
jgi:hypothetical protein